MLMNTEGVKGSIRLLHACLGSLMNISLISPVTVTAALSRSTSSIRYCYSKYIQLEASSCVITGPSVIFVKFLQNLLSKYFVY